MNGRSREEALLVRVRRPVPSDGEAVRSLVRRSSSLGAGGEAALPALAQHFADTALLAEVDERLVGFIGGYRPGTNRACLVVWQVDVDSALRRQGLGSLLLRALIQCPACVGIEYLEATIGAPNAAAERLFEAFARDLDAPIEATRESNETHYCIGPIQIDDALRVERPHEIL